MLNILFIFVVVVVVVVLIKTFGNHKKNNTK
jgi:hypothetical protein